MTRHRPLFLAVLVGIAPLPDDTRAQAIRGEAVNVDDAPVVGARVVALDTLGDARARAATDSAGHFTLELLEGGRYRVRLARAADTVLSRPLELAFDEEVELRIRLGPGGADSIEVTSRYRPSTSHLHRYYERLEQWDGTGRGVFITRAELDTLDASTVGRAVRLVTPRRFRAREGSEPCRPPVYWNAIPMNERWHSFQSRAGRMPTDDVEGIEVYYADRMELPASYRDERCGVVLIWTPRGTSAEGRGSLLTKLVAVVAVGLLFFLAVGS